MSSLITKGNASGTGSVTLESPNTNSDFTISLPAATGTAMVSGNMPAFSYYGNADQNLTSGTATKVQYNTSLYDTTSGMYSNSNYRFTPTVAGYYMVYAFFEWQGYGVDVSRDIYIYKNGGAYRRGQQFSGTGGNSQCEVSGIVYLNGSTDYLEIYGIQNSGVTLSIYNGNGQNYNCFEACLIRTA